MPHNVSLITTIAVAFGLALVLGFLAVRLKLPALVGYLVAGIIVGPATPGFVADIGLSQQLAEIGVMLLMFGVGLHFSIEDLLRVRRIALPGALVQSTVATALGLGLAVLWGWGWGAGLVFGLALSVASTVVLLRALEDHGSLETVNGHIAVGWLVVEDLLTVLVLVLLPPLAGFLGGNPVAAAAGRGIAATLAITLGQVALFVVLMLVVGRRLFPWILWQVAKTGSRELFTLCVVAAAVGVAYAASELFGVSFALGAFFAGMVMRSSSLSHRAADESLPLRDAFSVLFFVSVGMLFDPRMLLDEPLRLLAVLGVVMVGKSAAALLIVRAFNYPLTTALVVSAGLAQVGEFSFILVGLGLTLGLIPVEAQSLVIAAAVISIAVNPFLFDAIEPVRKWIGERSPRAHDVTRPADPLAELPASVDPAHVTGHVVIVGYGRVGRRIAERLAERGIALVVVEENREAVERLRAHGVHAVSGDATDPAVLIQAHVARARLLVIATPDTFGVRKMTGTARTLNPKIGVLVRTHSDEEADLLRKEGGTVVFMGEHELATAMTRHVLDQYPGTAAAG
jgi:CPA2 family monovalent cation:H+ antiporter-2